jgi:hypothetical protein
VAQSAPAVQPLPDRSLQTPAASQVLPPKQRSSSADLTAPQWPALPGRLQAWQGPSQGLSQQTPSTQRLPAHSSPPVQALPLLFRGTHFPALQ